MSNEFRIKLNGYKIKHLFKNIRKLNGGKNLLAKKLGITSVTLDEYLRSGQELLDKYEEQLLPIYELDIDAIDDDITANKKDFVDKFLELTDSVALTDKNKNSFDVYFLEQKELIKENTVYEFQKSIINNIKWSDNELENKKIVLLMMFKLIYDRGQMSLDEELLYLKNKYAKSSSKQVGILVKELERRNKEDFGVVKDDNSQKAITFNQFNNFTHYSIEHDKANGILKQNPTKLIEDNKDDIIEIEPLE